MGKTQNPVQGLVRWVKRQSHRVKTGLGMLGAMVMLVILRFLIVDHDNLFVLAEAVHAIGIGVLIYKLQKGRSCSGLSLQSQELTALFLAVRLYCSFVMEYDIHTLLDTATLVATLWVIYMVRFKLQATHVEHLDTIKAYYVIVPCAVLAALIHPATGHHFVNRILWAFCVYLEAVSVFPQLRVMLNSKVVEPFTAHYVFALGVSRFLSCAHWILQIMDGRSYLFSALSYGLWPLMVLISEVIQTFILADFCYLYVKSVLDGQSMVRIPSGVV